MPENKFKGWCAAHGVRVKDIAELLDIHVNTACAKVNGRQQFTLKQIKVLCSTYDMPADIFLG